MNERNNESYLPDGEVLRRILDLFERASPESRERILHTLHTFFSFDKPKHLYGGAPQIHGREHERVSIDTSFSEDRTPSPKEFLLEKKPQTDVEKVACLAYYLAHYRAEENFKTLDISKLNTEAAQIKLSNAAQAVDNAAKTGLIISSTKGHKKISALGELYVQALPDKSAARSAIAHGRPKRRKQRSANSNKE